MVNLWLLYKNINVKII